jgi:hypothetical protein
MVSKYSKNLVEVRGTIETLGFDLDKNPLAQILCRAGPGQDQLVYLSAATTIKEPWAVVGPGQQVTVRGKLEKKTFGGQTFALLKESVFINPGPNTSVTIKSTDLYAELVKDSKGTDKKYKSLGLIVVGKVVRMSADKSTVSLEGGDTNVVDCETELVFGPALGEPLQVGKEARIYGRIKIAVVNVNGPILVLHRCLPILGK